jgi:uncharacterized protein YbjQ (UPF0145 family)
MHAEHASMLVATVAAIEGRPVQWYLGVVSGGAVAGPSWHSRVPARGGESGSAAVCPVDLRDARDTAIFEMLREAAERGANAVIGVGLGFEAIGAGGDGMAMMVTASGTAVRV